MALTNFATGSVRDLRREETDCEDDDEDEHTRLDENVDKDDDIADLNKSQRFMMVKGKLGSDDLKNEQEKKMDDMWNEFGGQATTIVGKNKTQTQFLMIGDVLTVITYLQNDCILYDLHRLKERVVILVNLK